ncbi:lactate/malate family dehydrogenase [Vibrio salinus]|uniref:lactate/malate family dehydrogenase n=1 Tax=Vibrio salinus TaxID=2899784 RepID=UPI001E36CC81|nr:L-lactate dehydrogenase [Vibrio salinus]MCE0492508.1 L-lactate dehydrogenase [Vibrio salinus]
MKISVIGAGAVGVGVCNYLLMLGSIRELVLYDRTLSRAEGEAFDFRHTASLTFSKNTKVIPTDNFMELACSDIIVMTAGAQIKKDQNRLELAEINSQIGVSVAKELEKVAPNAVIIVVTNPCDIVTHFMVANTGYSPSQIISAGCVIDTARLMSIVAHRVNLDPKNIFGYVLGEHGSHCFTPKSLISIGGQPIDYYCETNNLPRIDSDELLDAVKQAGFEIFRRKQNTTHGISASVFRIIQAVAVNERSILPVGTLLRGEYGLQDVALSLPTVVGRMGAESILIHPFTDEELNTLHHIAIEMKKQISIVADSTGLSV